MSKSITQATQNDKQISESVKGFITRFHVSSALRASNAYNKKGTSVVKIFQYLFLLIFSNRSMYMNLITGRNAPDFAKDTVYLFMKRIQINWIRFTGLMKLLMWIKERSDEMSDITWIQASSNDASTVQDYAYR